MNTIQKAARIGGILYLIIIVAGIFSEVFVLDKLVVFGDATATANKIMASQLLLRISISGNITMLMCAVALALILYVMLRPVNRPLALLAVFFNLVSIAIDALGKLNLLSVLSLLGGADYLKAFEPQQLQALAYHSLKLHASAYSISLVFFGANCLFWGYLIFKSPYFSRMLGILITLAGVCYIINSFSWFLAPAFAARLFPTILLPCLVGELSLCLWLLFKRKTLMPVSPAG